jgi:hypothetical protein
VKVYSLAVRSLSSVVLACVALGCSHAPPPASPVAPMLAPSDRPPAAPEVLVPASVDFDIVNLLLDKEFVYWAHRGEKGLVKVPLGGGPPITLVPGSDQPVTSLATDASYLYFTTGRRVDTENSDMLLGRRSPRAGHFEGVVARLKKDGTTKVEEIASGRYKPEDVAVDGANVYWISAKKDAMLVRQAIGQVDAEAVVAHGNFLPGSLVVSGGFAYWVDLDAGPAVVRVSTNGGEPQKLSTAVPQPNGTPGFSHPVRLCADDTAAYITDAGPMEGKGLVVRIPIAGGAPTVVADNLNTPRAVAVLGGWVYWLNKGTGAQNFQDGSLEKAPVAGGLKVTLATRLVAPDRLALGGTRVAWTEVNGAIKDMAR